MTIREMENATGLTRANIRFYENQGLLNVERKENNYREYTREHIQLLLRVKLLRALGMSIEEIRALQTGQEDMTTALDRQIKVLEKQMMELQKSRQVCCQMRSDGVRFDTLDARHYLDLLNRQNVAVQSVIYQDKAPRIFAPWQRYWARDLDAFFCTCLTILVWAVMTNGLLLENSFLCAVIGFGLTLVLEPVQLHLFGTTLGKFIFGIRVEYPEGGKLSLYDAFWRRWSVFIHGQGCGITALSQYKMFKSYQAYESGEVLPWEEIGEVTIRDTKPMRYAGAVLAAAAVFGGAVVGTILTQLPENRGELTVQQFCENYRELAHADFGAYVLRDDGTWSYEPEPNTAYLEISTNTGYLDFVFETDGGAVTSVTISEKITGAQEQWIYCRTSQMRLMSLAMLMAQKDYNIFASDEEEILLLLNEKFYEDFTVTVCGLEFTYDVDITGYRHGTVGSSGIFVDDDDPDTEPCYSMTFTVKKAG